VSDRVSEAPQALRVLFAGTPDVALPSLRALVEDGRIEVVGVLANPDRPRGRSAQPARSPVAEFAHERGLVLLQPERPIDALQGIRELGADIGAVVAYGAILPQTMLEALPLGFVNLHFSLLPRWRGAAPVQRAIAAGDQRTGVSVFQLDRGMDTGPLLRQLEVTLPEASDAGDVLADLAVLGAPVLVEALLAVASGEEPTPQPVVGVTLAPKLTAEDALVDWRLPAERVAARIRSVSPRPGALTHLGGRRIKVGGPSVVAEADTPTGPSGQLVPGEVLSIQGGLLIACGEGAVQLARLQQEGRRWVSADEFVNGQRVAPGDVLGA
jgi:methionyl-tRNA formyltransferase